MSTIKGINKEIQYLSKKDKVLGEYMEQVGVLERELSATPFAALVSVIIEQQISTIAAERVEHNLMKLVGKDNLSKINIEDILKLDMEKLSHTGLGKKKAAWLMQITENVKSKKIDFDGYSKMEDKEVIENLIQNEGIGAWSAKMFCIFGLGRKNIISYSDFGIRKGMMKLYGKESLTKQDFKEYAKSYEPYATIASIYLWNLAGSEE